ncbi:MAG: hypothetical protein J4O12_09520, partial [Chloroflexi bacterium]|nr:hypothetical protein [Chloroflexota bacterium]
MTRAVGRKAAVNDRLMPYTGSGYLIHWIFTARKGRAYITILVEDNKRGGQENIMEKRAIRMSDESGQSMVVAAMVLSVLMGFAALVI